MYRWINRRYVTLGLALVTVMVLKTVVFASSGVSFAVNSPSDARDARVGDGVCRTVAGACTLRAAIQEANALPGADELRIPAGTYEIGIPPLNQNDVTTGDLDITDSLILRGSGAGSTIVDGGAPPAGAPPQVRGLDRLFEVLVDGGVVEFSGITFRDGYADEYGGAIANSSTATVKVTSSTLTGNVAGKAGGAIDNHLGGEMEVTDSNVLDNFAPESGSAINNNRGGTLTVENSTVSSNSAGDAGLDENLVGAGAIANNAELDTAGTITVAGSQLSDNRAGGGRSGAAISNDGAGTVLVEQTAFSKNRATANGGAIFNGSGTVTVVDSIFTENAATDGGAIYSSADKGGFVAVRDAAFVSNGASGGGGAVAASGSGSLEVLDTTFSKNRADDWGGAVLNQNQGNATIENVAFSDNSGLNGGGFANEGNGLVTVDDSTFTKNTAFVPAVAVGGEGGGMHSNSGGEVVVSGGTFIENVAISGGGFSNEGGGSVAITGTRFTANHAQEHGGGLLIQSGAVRMLNIDVVGNFADSAEEGGGGISYAGDKVVSAGENSTLALSRIRDNKAKGPGGGIDSRGDGPLAITTTSITGNTAATGGAVHHVGDAGLEITRSTLSGNFAEGGGGVFSDGDGEATVENTSVSGNRAGQFGGGLLVSSRVHMRNSTLAGNSAPSGGGINNGGGDLVGDGSVFLLNTIVANSPTGGNCAGTMTSLGGNVDSANTCALRELTDQPGTDPRLGPLADNGGPTQTHALLAGSPAQENAICTEADPCPTLDQRGVERPRFEGFDAGSYESELTPGGGGDAPRCAGLTERPVLSDYDSWVSEGAPAANFGNDSILKVDAQGNGNERALVHFNLPPIPPGCKLIGATLRLYSSAATDGRTLEAVRIASTWDELGVSWGNQPPTSGPAATTQSGLDVREWDVLAQTLDMYVQGDHGFLIRDGAEDGVGEQSFHSGEKGPEHPPELVLVFDDPDAPPVPGTCPTTPQLVSADRDAWLSESSPLGNFGTDSTLKVKSQAGTNARALIRFALPRLPAGCTSVASASMRVEAAAAKEGRTLEALQVASAWAETGVTWANQPAATGPAAAIASAQGLLEWEVTEQLLGMYTTGNHGFVIRDAVENGVGDEQTLNSRHKLTDTPPQLVLAFDDSTPETEIESGPDAVSDDDDATFTFTSDRDDARFECSPDGSAFAACSSPYTVQGLSEGDHVLEVRATRRVRAVDPTPARYAWRVATPPETTITDGPSSPSSSPDATVAFAADDPEASFECSLNGAPFASCTSPAEYGNLADGPNQVRVRGVDRLGNIEPTPASHAWTVAVPPDTTIESGPPALGNGTSARFEFGGTDNGPQPPALTFECRLDGGAWADCTSPHELTALGDGRHTFEVQATDRAGNREAEPASRTWTVDTVAPVTTIDAGPPELYNSASATFEFDADEPAGFECRLDRGAWTGCTSPHEIGGLADGQHTFDVRATDRAGNQGAPASRTWTVDIVAPDTTIGSGPADPSSSPDASFQFGAGEPASFQCQLDDGQWVACSSPQSYPGLEEGEHTFRVQAADEAGNREAAPAVYTWTVDTTPPDTTITRGPADPSNDGAPSFEFGANEPARFECSLDAGVWGACASPHQLTGLADGKHTFAVQATDEAGNREASAAVHTWTVDTTPPSTTIARGPADPSNDRAPTFSLSANEAVTFECRLDAGEWAACSSGHAYADLADGQHTVEARATDRAGNLGDSATWTWTVDTVAPATTIAAGPPDPTNDAAASFEFGADEAASFDCRLDAGAWGTCSGGQSYAGLADGKHIFQVRATDRAGNAGEAAAWMWTVDTLAPDTTISSAPADPSNDPAPRFEFGAGEPAGFECQLDAGAWEPCSSGHSYGGLADGQHAFRVQAIDRAGNREAEAATWTWMVDTVVPDTTIVSGPADPTSDSSASFGFQAGEAATFECRLDTGDWATCTSPNEYTGLTDGRHSFEVTATDRAGNREAVPAAYAWTIEPPRDTTAPTTSITAGPANPTNSSSATFSFTGADDRTDASMIRFECRLDSQADADFAACSSPRTYSGLADGPRTFEVRAVDLAGNRDTTPATYAWTVDTTAPQATITAGPAGRTNDPTPTFSFSSEAGSGFQCRVDGGGYAACAPPHTASALADGRHTFEVRATDAAGNTGTAAGRTFTVDTTAPQTTITVAPPAMTSSTSASFGFSSDEEGAAFECSLDGAPFQACTSPRAYSGLTIGTHQFRVRATDPAGNVDATPASHSWTISAPPGCGTPASVPAAADAWIDENSPTNNKGTDSILKVQSKGPRDNFRALVRFSLPVVPQGCVLESAALRLYAASAKPDRTLHAIRLAAPWSESQVSWATQPATSGAATATGSGQGYREWGVTAQVQAMYAGPNHGFLIRDAVEGQDAEQQFHSREKGQNPPQLVVRFAPAGG